MKKILTSNGKILTENGKILTANVESGGGLIEVSELPEVGKANTVYKLVSKPTQVPNSGYVEKVYFNTKLSVDEVTSLLEQLTYIEADGENYFILNDTDSTYFLFVFKINNEYAICLADENENITTYFINMIGTLSEALGVTFTGWNPNVANNILYNNTASSSIGDYTVGSENDKLINLISTTPLEAKEEYYIYGDSEPTQVPNSGAIENLYFNTKLSNEEVDNILSQLTYDEYGYAYVVGAYEKGRGYGNIIIVEANAFTEGQIPSGYIIGHMNDITNMASTDFIYMSNQGLVDLALTIGINTKVGWNMETLNLNQTFNGAFGTENDKLINVISTTPYPNWTEISGGGATVKATPIAVPNTGYVERVYLNKSLSFDEVNAICTKANNLVANETLKVNCILNTKDNSKVLTVMKFTETDDSTFNVILYPNWLTVIWSEKDFTSPDGTMNCKKGWNIEQDYLEINAEVVAVSEDDIPTPSGTYNDQLTELFSINNVFETNEIELSGDYDGNPLVLSNKYVKKTVVPNEGYVERVYFNTSLSIDEVKAILEKFYTYADVDTLDNAMWLINIDDFNNSSVAPEKLYWIMPSRYTGDYAIVNALAQVIFKSNSSKWTGGDFVGWNPEFITTEKPYLEINSQVFPIVTENGKEIKVGGFNDKIVDLFSLTPFEETIYDSVEVDIKEMLEEKKLPLSIKVNVESTNIVSQDGEIIKTLGGDYEAINLEFNELPSFWQETVFVNGNYVEKLYFNTELTTDEIDAIFSTLTYDDNSHLITQYATAEAGRFGSIYIIKMETNGLNGYTIRISNFDGDSYIYASNQEIADYIKSNYNKSVEVGLNITEFPINNTIHTVSNEISNLTNLISSKPLLKNTINVESYLDNKQMPMSIKVNIESSGGGEDMLQARVDATNSCEYLFYQYKGDNVDFIKDLDTSNVTNMSSMFNGCSALETIPQLDTSNVIYMNSMFNGCSALETIPQLDMIKVTNRSQMFYNCSKLTNLTLLNIKAYIDLSQSEKLTLESLINTVKEFINVGSARILTMGTANLEKIASTYVKFTDSSVNSIPTNEKGDVVVCESTDTGAMLLKDYALLKNWTLA